MLSELFRKLSEIEYLQGYEFVEEAAEEGRPFQLIPTDKTLRKAGNICKLLPEDMSGQRVLDIGCNKGFFSLECIRRNAEYVLGVDVREEIIQLLQQISKASPLFRGLEFSQNGFSKELLDKGSFDTVLCFSCYHYLYAAADSHNDVFALLAALCRKQLLLELPLELDDNFARAALEKDLEGERLKAYNTHAILHAASLYFGSVRYIANSGFLRTRDIFLLENPNEDNSFSWEWEGKENVWSQVR